MVSNPIHKPGLRLKERVRLKELTVTQAMQLLKDAEPLLHTQTETWKWLLKHKGE
jgi:hypothetical protein